MIALEDLLAKAFRVVPAVEANTAISDVRDERSEAGKATSYECVLPATDSHRHLLEDVAPLLVYFLDCRGAKAPGYGRVFVSLFVADSLYFLAAGDVLDHASQALGVPIAELVRRYGDTSVQNPPS